MRDLLIVSAVALGLVVGVIAVVLFLGYLTRTTHYTE